MRIYISHSSDYDYETELYQPLKDKFGDRYDIYLPHDRDNSGKNTKELMKVIDLLIAEVSLPSTGQGIELGRAEALHIPMLLLKKEGIKASSSLKYLGASEVTYMNIDEMITSLEKFFENIVE